MTELFIVVVEDRHADPDPYVFTNRRAAIDFAWSQAHTYALADTDVEVRDVEGYEYFVSYSPESDKVWVKAKTLDEGATR